MATTSETKAKKRTRRKNDKKRATTTQVTFRIEKDWLKRADKVAEKLSSNGVKLTRTDGFRAVMAAGFEVHERRH
jgi:ACT domain-containing protein